jgi:hypothetical protein
VTGDAQPLQIGPLAAAEVRRFRKICGAGLAPVREPGDVAIVRALTWSYTFDYEYGPDGALRATTVTNREGRRVFPA